MEDKCYSQLLDNQDTISIKYILSIAFLLFALATSVWGQEEFGKLFLKNYAAKEYKASIQNWTIAQDQRGVLYVGNNAGLLEYDGTTWRLIPVPNGVRAIAIGQTGRIFVGSTGEMGYMELDSVGGMYYVSLLDKLSPQERDFVDVWDIHSTPDGVYFQSLQSLIRWDNGTVKSWLPQASFNSSIVLGNSLIIKEIGGSFQKVEEGELLPLAQENTTLHKLLIYSMTAFEKDKILLGSRFNGLFVFDLKTETLTPFQTEAQTFLETNEIYSLATLPNQRYAIGTLNAGVIILDKQGNIVQQINQQSNLRNQTIHKLFLDKQQGLWLALDNGISRVEISSPFNAWDEDQNLKGIVLAVVRHQNTIYVATNNGVFYLENGVFQAVQNMEEESWDLLSVQLSGEDKLLAANAKGIYEIQQKKAILIHPDRHVFKLYAISKTPNEVYAGVSNGLLGLRYQKNKWEIEQHLGGIVSEVRSIASDKNQHLWLGTQYEGVAKIEFAQEADSQQVITTWYGTKDGLPTLNAIQIHRYNQELIFTTDKGIYTFDPTTEKFVPDARWGKEFADGSTGVSLLIQQSNANYWLRPFDENRRWIEIYRKQADETFIRHAQPFKRLPEMDVYAIFPDQNNITWIGSSEGLFRYDDNLPKNYQDCPQPIVRRVTVNKDSIIYNGHPLNHNRVPNLKIEENSLLFHYAVPEYENQDNVFFQYKLENYDEDWSAWTQDSKKEYTNLPTGDYTFRIRAKNTYDTISQEADYTFKITPFWYSTLWAYGGYILAGGALVWVFIFLNTRRLRLEKQRLEAKIKARTAEIREQNKKFAIQSMEIAAKNMQIEETYQNVQLLTEIGQQITTHLSVEEITNTVYQHINKLMDVSIFLLGLYDQRRQHISFPAAMEKGEKLPPFSYSMGEKNKLSVLSLIQKQEIIINNYRKNFQQYTPNVQHDEKEDLPESLVYLPLMVDEEPIGVLGVQSFKKEAYSANHISILKSLAAYITIALENAEAHQALSIQNRKTRDSINYAQRIQDAILPNRDVIDTIVPDSFVFFRPRDIVSGDFYFFAKNGDKIVVAAVDCTGHGVPGGFMSMIGYEMLNEVVNRENTLQPSRILQQLHEGIVTALRQDSDPIAARDGMAISICVFDTKAKTYTFSNASQPIFIYNKNRENELLEIQSDRTYIGGYFQRVRSFNDYTIDWQEGDMLYLFSDGFQDQFGGKNNRKYMKKRLKALFKDNYTLPITTQHQSIAHAFDAWKGKTSQIDDVLVIGVRF